MVDTETLLRIREQLNKSGRIREIIDDEGKILPSPSAMEQVSREHAGASEFEKYCAAQCLTLLELADKYRKELVWPSPEKCLTPPGPGGLTPPRSTSR